MKTKLGKSNKRWFKIFVVVLVVAFLGGIALILIFHNNATTYPLPIK